MKGGAVGKCPALENDDLPNMLILPQNKMAVLVDEIYYSGENSFGNKLAVKVFFDDPQKNMNTDMSFAAVRNDHLAAYTLVTSPGRLLSSSVFRTLRPSIVILEGALPFIRIVLSLTVMLGRNPSVSVTFLPFIISLLLS